MSLYNILSVRTRTYPGILETKQKHSSSLEGPECDPMHVCYIAAISGQKRVAFGGRDGAGMGYKCAYIMLLRRHAVPREGPVEKSGEEVAWRSSLNSTHVGLEFSLSAAAAATLLLSPPAAEARRISINLLRGKR